MRNQGQNKAARDAVLARERDDSWNYLFPTQ